MWGRALTEEEMAHVHDVIDASVGPGEILVDTMKAVFGIAFAEEGRDWNACEPGSIVPWEYAIPKEQWEQICTWMQEACEPQFRVPIALEWMNKGPSASEFVPGIGTVR